MPASKLPLVTCLCLTRNRRAWLPKAIECFERQTYPNRELLIIADGEEGVADLVPAGDRFRLMVLGWTLNVGEKRNLGCVCARGELIAVWDDDDYSAPARLADQVDRLAKSGKAVTGYHSMKFTDGRDWWLYNGGAGFCLATSLCFRREWWTSHRFQELQIGQDEAFAWAAAHQQQLAWEDDLELMYATNHPGNTSPRTMSGCNWTPLPGFRWADSARKPDLVEP